MNIGQHYSNDDPRHYAFQRDSKLPRGTFDHGWRITASGCLWAVTAVAAIVFLMVLA